MPTKTKPKPVSAPLVWPVALRPEDRDEIAAYLSVDREVDVQAHAGDFEKIEACLTRHATRLHQCENQPLPAHIVAALKPIAALCHALAKVLNPGNLPPAVIRSLNIDAVLSGEAWQLLTAIETNALCAIEPLSRQPSSGLHVQRFNEVLAYAVEDLGLLFDRLRPGLPGESAADRRGWKDDFLKVCRGRLPKGPSTRRRSPRK